jgi:CRISPR-associated protein Csm5
MSDLHTTWNVEIEILSPLHVGSGSELLLGYDLVPHRDRTYRVDEDVLLEQALVQAESAGDAAMNRLLAGRPAVELLTEADFVPGSPLFRYAMPGTPFTRTIGAQIQEQIKDVYDRLYVPGSSFKGALRTLLAWGFYTRQERRPDLSRLRRSRSWASQDLERDVFGRDPNRDWLRALHVEDTQPLEPNGHLSLRTVRVYPTQTRDSPGLNVDVEAVEPGTVFQTAIAVDEYGFQEQAASQLGWQGKRAWLGQLVTLGKEYARERLLTEAEFFNAHGGPQATQAFYGGLVKQIVEGELADDEFLLQVGWGTGWESKTLGSGLLRQDDDEFERLLDQYRMTKERNRQPGDPFPKSRTLALRDDQPAIPMGWMRVRLVGFVPGEEPKITPSARKEPAKRPPTPAAGQPQRPQDLQPGQIVEGRVRNVVNFGAFVDVGVGHDGLVHISELAEGYVASVESVVRVGQRVRVKVLSVERRGDRWRISLTMKGVE